MVKQLGNLASNRIWIGMTVAATAGLVAARLTDHAVIAGAFKLTASTAFLLLALSAGALGSRYGKLILVGLGLSWWGDAFLLGSSETFFLLGLVSFLFAHASYCAGFWARGLDRKSCARGALIFLPSIAVLVWLLPYLDGGLRGPVVIYIVVISTMVVLAAGTQGRGASRGVLIGAVLFYASDLAVARGQWVESDFPDYAWGLPLYYAGQLFLAASVGDKATTGARAASDPDGPGASDAGKRAS